MRPVQRHRKDGGAVSPPPVSDLRSILGPVPLPGRQALRVQDAAFSGSRRAEVVRLDSPPEPSLDRSLAGPPLDTGRHLAPHRFSDGRAGLSGENGVRTPPGGQGGEARAQEGGPVNSESQPTRWAEVPKGCTGMPDPWFLKVGRVNGANTVQAATTGRVAPATRGVSPHRKKGGS